MGELEHKVSNSLLKKLIITGTLLVIAISLYGIADRFFFETPQSAGNAQGAYEYCELIY
jgi:hypothetical protein